MPEIIIVTGSITSGKTYTLEKLVRGAAGNGSTFGFMSVSDKREYRSGAPSLRYELHLIHRETVLPWAIRDEATKAFQFSGETIDILTRDWITFKDRVETLVVDDLGFLEASGGGFAPLVSQILKEQTIKKVYLSMMREAIPQIIERLGISDYRLVDLDGNSINSPATTESEQIAVYSTINGMIEVGIGSTLHTFRVPFKGHFLSLVQNLLMLLYGKKLSGKGLWGIAFISACMKSFSPAGSKLKPMFFIFVQGLLFSLPSMVMGWNLITAAIGSVLMGLSTVFMSLALDYLLYGRSVFTAYVNGAGAFFSFLGYEHITFWVIVMIVSFTKVVLALIVTGVSWFVDFSCLIHRFKKRLPVDEQANMSMQGLPVIKEGLLKSAVGACRDMTGRGFLLSFLFLSLLIVFFSRLSASDLTMTLTRALTLSFVGFLIARRIDYNRVQAILKRFGASDVAYAMKRAVFMFAHFRKDKE